MVKAVGSGRCYGCTGTGVFLLLTRGASVRGVCIVLVGSPGTLCGREAGSSRPSSAESSVRDWVSAPAAVPEEGGCATGQPGAVMGEPVAMCEMVGWKSSPP